METFAFSRIQILLRGVPIFALQTMKKCGLGRLAMHAKSIAHKKRLPQTENLAQGAHKRPPRCLHSSSRRPRDASMSAPGRFQDVQNTEKCAHGAPPGLQGDSMAPQHAPRTRPLLLQDGSKTTSNCSDRELAAYIAFGTRILTRLGFQERLSMFPVTLSHHVSGDRRPHAGNQIFNAAVDAYRKRARHLQSASKTS